MTNQLNNQKTEKVIEVKNLSKRYGKLLAVDSVSFEVNRGEIFGLLGENGAGKTTTLEMIEGLRTPSAGEIDILGINVGQQLSKIKEKIGIQLQSSAYYDYLGLNEILDLFGSFYPRRMNAADLLKLVDLGKKAKSYVQNLSGGQKQRFSIIASLVNDPEIVFLDEPTTGLDPIARRKLWELISKIRDRSKTVILTTHYLEEAEILCDRIAIMERGKIIKIGKTHQLIEAAEHPYKIEFIVSRINKDNFTALTQFGRIRNIVGKSNHFEVRLKSQDNLNRSLSVIEKLNPESFTVSRASLEDLFIELTGKNIEE